MADTSTIDSDKMLYEALFLVRNSGVLSSSERSVLIQNRGTSFSNRTDYTDLIPSNNTKNIYNVTIDGSPLKYGFDYYVEISSDRNVFFFSSTLSGSFSYTRAYGTDAIFPDYPRTDLSISSFPRVAVDVTDIITTPGGFGSVDVSEVNVSVTMYATKNQKLREMTDALRSYLRTNKSNVYYLGHYIQIISVSPILPSPREMGKDKVNQITLDFRGYFRYEQ